MNRALLFLSSFVAIAACGGQVTSLGSVGDDAKPGVNATLPDSTEPTEQTGQQSPSTPAQDGGASDAGGSGKACNPILASPSAQCPAGEYCEADDPGTCGIGRCVTNPPPPPPFCPSMECGCDGKLRCADGSRTSGVDVGSTQCTFACGNKTCDGLTQYCEHATGGVALPDGGANESWSCNPIPTSCATNRSCACVTQAVGPGAYVCESEKDQKVTVHAMLP